MYCFLNNYGKILSGKCFCLPKSSKMGCEVPEVCMRNGINYHFQFGAIDLE